MTNEQLEADLADLKDAEAELVRDESRGTS